jgi:lipopolysaccharide/colanic/teichoic acid biosynthesis glycosyltransferase
MTHLDELPELWNVVRGEMSLIGPRPERPEIAEVLSECVPDYETRLLVKPGIFGLHSLNFPPDTDVESVRTKLVVDRFYIERATVGMDVLIFLDVVRRFFGVPLRLTERFAERALGGKVDGGGFK